MLESQWINIAAMESFSVTSVHIFAVIELDSSFFSKVKTLVNSQQWFL